jgi:DNA primase
VDKLSILAQHLGSYKTMAGQNHYFACPSCHHKNNKLTIHIEKKVFSCFHCGLKGKSFLYLLKVAGASNIQQYKKVFNEEQKKNLEDIDNIFGKESVKENKLMLPKGYENLFKSLEKVFYKPAVEYLLNRGVTKEDILKYDIHYSVSDQRILFPSYNRENNLNYYVARTIQPHENYKYKNATASKRDVIFNEHLIEWSKPLYIVEGIFDAILSRKNAVPILGSNVGSGSLLFRRLLQNHTEVIIALDADAKKKMFKMINELVKYNIPVTYVDWKSEERDIAEMGSDKFEEIVTSGSVKSFTFEDQIKERLFN